MRAAETIPAFFPIKSDEPKMQPQTYHIYARKTYDEPLALFGQLDSADGEPTKADVLEILDPARAEEWVEVILIPVAEILWARQEDDAA